MIGNTGKDWLSGQIDLLARGLAVMLFGKSAAREMVSEDEESGGLTISEDILLLHMLQKYISEGKINEAENLLFSSIEQNSSMNKLKTALNFYSQLDEKSDEFLQEHDFSRQEIYDGLAYVAGIYDGQLMCDKAQSW